MTVAGACGAEERPESSARPARAGLSNPFRFLFPARRPRLGVRGSLAAALVLLALSVLAPAGPVHAQEIAVQVSGEGISTRDMTWRGTWSGAGFGDAVWDPPRQQRRIRDADADVHHPQCGHGAAEADGDAHGVDHGQVRAGLHGGAAARRYGGARQHDDVRRGVQSVVKGQPSRADLHSEQRPSHSQVVGCGPVHLHYFRLRPRSGDADGGRGPHADGGLEMSWSESQNVLNVRGRRVGRYRVFYTQSGSTGSTRELTGHSHHLASLDTSIATTVRVEAYDQQGLPIAEGTTTYTPTSSAANRKPTYPGLPSEIFVEFDKKYSYTIPAPVDPDSDTVTDRVLDEDGQVVPQNWNATTRVLSNSPIYITTGVAAIKRVADPRDLWILEATDEHGAVTSQAFEVKLLVPLKFTGTPGDLQLERGKGIWTTLPGGYRGETLPASRMTRTLTRTDGGAAPPSCTGSWGTTDWICFDSTPPRGSAHQHGGRPGADDAVRIHPDGQRSAHSIRLEHHQRDVHRARRSGGDGEVRTGSGTVVRRR